jgi:hypothetical protein
MATATTISINRAPVLALWAAVVAERLGFDRDEALSLGRAVAGLNAQSKGRRLGVFRPHEEEPKEARDRGDGERLHVEVCGRDVPTVATAAGVPAVTGGKPVDPDGVERYLEDKFGDELTAVRATMAKLAKGYTAAELAEQAYPLYERFRPAVPEGKSGWGAKGVLDLGLIGRLASDRKPATRTSGRRRKMAAARGAGPAGESSGRRAPSIRLRG